MYFLFVLSKRYLQFWVIIGEKMAERRGVDDKLLNVPFPSLCLCFVLGSAYFPFFFFQRVLFRFSNCDLFFFFLIIGLSIFFLLSNNRIFFFFQRVFFLLSNCGFFLNQVSTVVFVFNNNFFFFFFKLFWINGDFYFLTKWWMDPLYLSYIIL